VHRRVALGLRHRIANTGVTVTIGCELLTVEEGGAAFGKTVTA